MDTTDKVCATLLILFVAYLGVCSWSYGVKTSEVILSSEEYAN